MVFAPRWSPDGRSLHALAQHRGRVELLKISLDGKREVVTDDVGFAIGGRPYGGGDLSVGGEREPVLAYTQVAFDRPGDIAVVQAGKARTLTQLNADLFASVDFGQVEALKLPDPAGPGEIDAWVIKPPGFKPGANYPLIIEIHGGPGAMYGPIFSTDFHRYAAEGYVVAYANLSGSVGYGASFANRIDLDHLERPLKEVTALADALVAKGYVDPRRLYLTGGSYGGQLTAYAVGKTTKFAAAAAASPVISWQTIQLAADTPGHVANRAMRGMAWEQRDLFWANSPLAGVGGVNTPTLLIVGEKDWRTPVHEAEQFYTALKLRGVDTALVVVPEGTHSISSRPSMINTKVDNVVAWFRAHDPAK
jgi:acylaminoacyl-peptidase